MKKYLVLCLVISLLSCNQKESNGYDEVLKDEVKAKTLINANMILTKDKDSYDLRQIESNNDTLSITFTYIKKGYRMDLGDSIIFFIKDTNGKLLIIDVPLTKKLVKHFYDKYIK